MGQVRAYLRASTDDQDASRAEGAVERFAAEHGRELASLHKENVSGTTLERKGLSELIEQSKPGDIILVEQIDRLSRLEQGDWNKLKAAIDTAGLRIVSIDLPTSHQFMRSTGAGDEFTDRMLSAINSMLLDMLAAVARKDYEDRRRRQAEGVQRAKAEGKYKGRPINAERHANIRELREKGLSIRRVAEILGCSPATVQRALKRAEEESAAP